MIPKFVAWEHWEDGLPEIVPARWIPGEAWALIKGAWKRVDSAEVGNAGRVLNESTFNESFADILIPLPTMAFQSSNTATTAQRHKATSYDLTGLTVLPSDGKGFVIGGFQPSKPFK